MAKPDKFDAQEYRNDWKYGREHGFVPNMKLPRWMRKDAENIEE